MVLCFLLGAGCWAAGFMGMGRAEQGGWGGLGAIPGLEPSPALHRLAGVILEVHFGGRGVCVYARRAQLSPDAQQQ